MFKRAMGVKETQTISRILDTNKEVSRYHSHSTHKFLSRRGSNSKLYQKDPLENKQLRLLSELKQTPIFQRKTSQVFFDSRNHYWATHYRKKQKFCGDIIVKSNTKTVFKHVITNYKRRYHPSNASKGCNDTSQDCSREPKKSTQFRESMREDNLKAELMRMTVLSRIIGENNRREARQMRRKSINRHRSLA